jgi:hypothetical protein
MMEIIAIQMCAARNPAGRNGRCRSTTRTQRRLGVSWEAPTGGSKLNGPPKPRTSIALDSRQEPGAGKPHAGICGGGAG